MPYSITELREMFSDTSPNPTSSVELGDLSGGKVIKLPADLKAKLVLVGDPDSEDRSKQDFALLCEMTKHIKNDRNIFATFAASPRGQDAVARKNGHFEDYMRRTIAAVRGAKANELEEVVVKQKIHCTDVGNSERLAAAFGNDMRYCAEQKVWYCWDGRRWEKNDPTGRIMSFAKKVARSILGEAQIEPDDTLRARLSKWAISSESRVRLDAMIALCRDLTPIRLEKFELFDHDISLVSKPRPRVLES